MPAPPDFDALAGRLFDLDRASGFTNGVGQCGQVVVGRLARLGIGRESQNLPATWCGEPLGVVFAEVVAVGFRIDRERPQYSGLVGVDVRQRRNSGSPAGGT